MANMGAIAVDIMANIDNFRRNMTEVQRTMQRVGNKMQYLGKKMTLTVTAPILAVGAASIKLAADFDEAMNKVDVVFKDSAMDIQNWSKTTLKSFGLAQGTALDTAALFGDMATGMGLSTKEASNMSKTLVGLSGDLASFKNLRIDIAETALKSIFTGETESLKNLGIVMTQANLEAWALSKGVKANIKDMTEAQKVQLRYAFVLDKTKNAQGDFLNTQDSASNQMRIFTESLKQLGQSMAKTILPVVTSIIMKLNKLIEAFSNLSERTKKTIVVIALLVAAIGPLLVITGTVIKSFITLKVVTLAVSTTFLKFIATIKTAFVAAGTFTGGMKVVIATLGSTILSIVATTVAIGALVSAIFFAATAWQESVNLMRSVMEYLGAFTELTVLTVSSAIGLLVNAAATGIVKLVNWATDKLANLVAAASSIPKLGKTFEGLANKIRGMKFDVDENGVFPNIKKNTDKILAEAIKKMEDAKKKVSSSWEELKKESFGSPEEIINKIKQSLEFDSSKIIDEIMKDLGNLGTTGVSAFDKLSDATSRYIDMLKSQIDTFKQAFGIFDKPQIERISGERLFVRMQAQTKLFEKWQNALDVIRNKLGASSKLFQQVAMQGPSAVGQVVGLAGLSAERLSTLESGLATRTGISTDVATGLVGQQISSEAKAPTVNLNGGVYVGDMAELANLIARELKLSGVT